MMQQIDKPMENNTIEDESMEIERNDILISYRQRFRKYKDLEDKFDLIYRIIEQNHLLLDTVLDGEKNEFELKLERLKYTNLTLIGGLESKGKKVDYDVELRKYNTFKEEIREFFGKICSLYTSTMYERHKEDRAFKKYMAMYAEARITPELTSQQWLTNALDDAYLRNAVDSGLINRKEADDMRERAIKIQEINDQKAEEFYKLTELLKKEKKKNKK